MGVWKFSPVAPPNNPGWRACAYRRPLLVEAPDVGEARAKAAQWYSRNFRGISASIGRDAFDNRDIYEIIKLTEENAHLEQQKYPLVS